MQFFIACLNLTAGEKMLAKKKHGYVTAKSGVVRDFLQENFAAFPVSGDHV